ncbi:CBN-FLP-17 protein [Caenorhabditis brenneri]|uniref:CBN-FLP-17 protein n=1 Tax=Caenorhabditis brenneri TaxID=135651 RepID=G0MRB1_CAEBE|nr:CBN-FLP-17 protein [Caenorhabditis brenneri]
MLSKLVLIACCLLISSSNGASMEEIQSEKFCEKFPTLHMCRLKEELTGSLVELQYLLQDGMNVGGQQQAGVQEVQKRKSAFVRFGKRSAPEEEGMEMEKRKSAFVRFGRSVGMEPQLTEKRKSQYIRFGK